MILFARRGRVRIGSLLVATLVGCGPDAPVESGPSSSTSTSDATDATGGTGPTGGTSPTGGTDSTPDGSTVTPTSNDTTTGDGNTCATDCGGDRTSFVDDGGDPTPIECDPFAPMCADDQKCAAVKHDGSSQWNGTMCVPLTGSKKPGEPCLAEDGGSTGVDDCQKGAMCWDLDDMGNGVCVQVCLGSEDMPMCSDPAEGCAVVNPGVLNICLDTCDPLVQDCAGDDVCLPLSSTYLCLSGIPDPGAVFESCDVSNGCEEGLVCLSPQAASECDQRATACCMPLCSIADGPPCPGVGQECLPVYEPQPPGFEDVGYCSVPR